MKLLITNYARNVAYTSADMSVEDAYAYVLNIVRSNYPSLQIELDSGNECFFNKQFLNECVVELIP